MGTRQHSNTPKTMAIVFYMVGFLVLLFTVWYIDGKKLSSVYVLSGFGVGIVSLIIGYTLLISQRIPPSRR